MILFAPKYPGQLLVMDLRDKVKDPLRDLIHTTFEPGNENLPGYQFGHTFNNPGVYNVVEGVNDVAATYPVTVAQDDRPILYLRPGDDFGQAVATANKYGGNRRILLWPGGVDFPVSGTSFIFGQNISVEGGGSRLVQTTRGTILNVSSNTQGTTIEDVTFDVAPNVTDCGAAVECNGIATAILYCHFQGSVNGVTFTDTTRGALVRGCVSLGLRGYSVWGQGKYVTLRGNNFPGSVNEHCIRASNAEAFTYFDNRLANPNSAKTCLAVHRGAWHYGAKLQITGAPLEVGPQGGDPGKNGGDPAGDSTRILRFEDIALMDAGIECRPGTQHAMFQRVTCTRGGFQLLDVLANDAFVRMSDDIHLLQAIYTLDASRGGNKRWRGVTLGQPCGKVEVNGFTMLLNGVAVSGDNVIGFDGQRDFSNLTANYNQIPANVPNRANGVLIPQQQQGGSK